jgi:hypothetical protein
MRVSIDLLISKEKENDFTRELEQLTNKYKLVAEEKSKEQDKPKEDPGVVEKKTTKPAPNKYLSMMMSDLKKKNDVKKETDVNDFDNLKTNCWRMYGFKKNIIGEEFQDDPDNSNLFHKIIGFQQKNDKTPIITLDDNGIRKKWTIDKICMFLGVPRGFIVEELDSKNPNIPKKPLEILKARTDETFIIETPNNVDENENKYSRVDHTIYINVKGTINTPVKCKDDIIIRPKNYRCSNENEKVKHRRAGMPVTKKRTEIQTVIPVREKKSHAELSEMNDTELSLYYGFDKNMVGIIFNQPTPKKGYERLHKITGFNIIKEKYVVVAYCYHTKKSLHFSVEHVQELIEDEAKKKKEEKKKEDAKEEEKKKEDIKREGISKDIKQEEEKKKEDIKQEGISKKVQEKKEVKKEKKIIQKKII